MKRPLCTNTDDGACSSWALAGTTFCLRHSEPARQGYGDPIDTGYRQGGFATSPVAARARVDLGPATTELPAAAPPAAAAPPGEPQVTIRASVTNWASPPPPAPRPGWLARTLRRTAP